MSTSVPKYYYLKYPDHPYRFIHWFAPIPQKKYKPDGLDIYFGREFDKFFGNCFGWVFIGVIIMLISWFELFSIILTSIPIIIFLVVVIFKYIQGFGVFLKKRREANKSIKDYPDRIQNCQKKLVDSFSNYETYITSKFKYRFNPETQKGKTAKLFQNSLKKIGVPVKIEAELKWKGLNLLPTTPYRGSDSKTWFDQFKYTADFVYVNSETGAMLDIEIDEDHHFSDEVQNRKDLFRNTVFICNGWSVIRFKDTEILKNSIECAKDVKNVIQQIEEIHRLIKDKLRKISMLKLDDLEYAERDIYNWIWKEIIDEDKPEWSTNIDFDSIEEVDYSDNQLMNYLEDWYKNFK